ncbi:hypothetical protein [Cerasicoccus maritimus]|uniref:hypothetical protein n=1 Tax=Cerasicoccus maritimus TaxID=490089 RepID=UPI0028525406|nr:hypothetical protein [Cerasicoccus maritimus]
MKFKNMFARSILCFLTLLALSAWLRAQPVQTGVEVRFLFLDESTGHYEAEIKGKTLLINRYPYSISDPLEVSVGERIPVYRVTETPEGPQRVQIADVPAGSESGSILAVLAPRRPTAESSLAYGVKTFDSDPDDFPVGSLRILNLGRSTAAFALGPERVLIKPGESHVVDPQPDRKNRFFARIAERTDDGWEVRYDNVEILRPGERVTGLFVYSPSGMKHTFTEAELEVSGDPPPSHYWLTYTERL